eukprot:Sspe_Gene.48654::Locus_25514_Transcript_1_1_Confidence_1.000_Length_1915::g.48654::m.48654
MPWAGPIPSTQTSSPPALPDQSPSCTVLHTLKNDPTLGCIYSQSKVLSSPLLSSGARAEPGLMRVCGVAGLLLSSLILAWTTSPRPSRAAEVSTGDFSTPAPPLLPHRAQCTALHCTTLH